MGKSTEHDPTLVRGITSRWMDQEWREYPSGYRMECSCGWSSEMVATADRAKTAWFDHEMGTA